MTTRLCETATLLLALSACGGAEPVALSSNSDGGAGASIDPSAGGAALGSGMAGDSGASEQTPCTTDGELSSPLRRLTRLEYDNTVRELLGVTDVPSDAFPGDPIAGGFDNNAASLSVPPLLAEQYLKSAEALAKTAVANASALLPCDPLKIGEEPCAEQFVMQFGRRAYRRPITHGEAERLLRAFAAGRADASFESGIELVIQALLQAPAFLYRFELGQESKAQAGRVKLTQYEVASRLSYFLWSSMPNDALLDAAEAGELSDADQVAARARDMLQDERAHPAIAEFYRQWLGLARLPNLTKDADAYPELDDALRAAMAAELPAFVEHVVWSADHRLSTLLTAPIGFVTGPLAELYGVEKPSTKGPTLVQLDPDQRAGVLTQAAVLAVHALPDQSSPVSRGKLVREKLLCQPAPAPPPNLNITPPAVDDSKSTRERFDEHTANAACAGCHELMDPIGFAFESYDALGRYRQTDGGAAIDASGWVAQSDDADGPFQNARELAERLSASKQVRDCVATQWFRYAFGRFEAPADGCSLDEVKQAFADSDADLLELLVAFTKTDSFLYRRALSSDEVTP